MNSTELMAYFQKNDDEIKSRFSQISRKSLIQGYRAKLMVRLDRANELSQTLPDEELESLPNLQKKEEEILNEMRRQDLQAKIDKVDLAIKNS